MKKLLKKISQIILRRNQNKLLHLCIVGLGNPGDKYSKTRHNAGYDFLDLIAKEFNTDFKYLKKIDADYVEIDFENQKIALIKPREFINRSGKTLQLVRKYKVKDTKDILVVHDDMDLEPGDVKLKLSGGHAGHNGIRDILKVIGNDFVRFDAEVRFKNPSKLSGVRFKYKIDNIRLGAHPGEPDNRTIGRPIVRFTNERPKKIIPKT